jgi:D-glycero-alpha-D-manno-heptose-7-phosphate kinase
MNTVSSLEFSPGSEYRSDGGVGSIVRAKSPLRISFSGGGTDFPHWYDHRPGAVLCSTINRYARVTAYPRKDKNIRIRSIDVGYMVDYQIDEQPTYDGVLDLAKATLKRLGVSRGLDIDVRSDAPAGSGLGGSSAMVSAVLGAVASHERRIFDNYELAELNWVIERQDLKIPGGKQDQYATTFGGFNVIEFTGDQVLVTPLRMKPAILFDLEAHLLLCYTGGVRVDLGLIDKQVQMYKEGRVETVKGMESLYKLVYDMTRALLTGKLNDFGEMLHEAYLSKKCMNPHVSAGTMADVLYDEARRNGSIGGKLMGAGGGGYLLLYCETHRQHKVRAALEALGGQFTDFAFEESGLQTWSTHCP